MTRGSSPPIAVQLASPGRVSPVKRRLALSFGALKGVKLKRIPDSAHFIMWDQPAAFQAEVKAFLAG